MTAIEALMERANNEEGRPGFHVTVRYADGSVLDAPVLKHGPDWMTVDELEDGPTMVMLRDATNLAINWGPGAAYAEGPRFEHLDRKADPASAMAL